MDKELDFNYSECIKAKSNLTSTTYVNVCNGKRTEVSYGSLDYIGFILVGALIVSIIIMIIAVILDTIDIIKW